ncbi:hypothetical protein VR010_01220 [Actinomycetaceae bacterium L2_0104]
MQIETSRKSMLILRGVFGVVFVVVFVPATLFVRIKGAYPSLNIWDYITIGAVVMLLIVYIRDIYWTWKRYEELYRPGR